MENDAMITTLARGSKLGQRLDPTVRWGKVTIIHSR